METAPSPWGVSLPDVVEPLLVSGGGTPSIYAPIQGTPMSLCCESCGHMPAGCTCDLSFADKLRSIRLSNTVTETRTKRVNYDREALADTFGPDARERYLDETAGLGAAYRRNGRWVRKDTAERRYVPVTEKEMAQVYMRGEEVEDA